MIKAPSKIGTKIEKRNWSVFHKCWFIDELAFTKLDEDTEKNIEEHKDQVDEVDK